MSGNPAGSGLGDWQLPPVEPADAPVVTDVHVPEARPLSDLPAGEPLPVPARTGEPPRLPEVPRRSAAHVEPVSPLRAAAGALVAVAGVLLGIGALLWATDAPGGDPTLSALNAQHTTSAAPSAAGSQVPSPALTAPATPVATRSSPVAVAAPKPAAAPKLPLTVLNNSTRPLLADRAASRFRAAGWPVKATGNFTGRVSATTIYYAPGQLPSAQRLQHSFRGLTRVRPRFAGLPGSGLTVVLTRSYTP